MNFSSRTRFLIPAGAASPHPFTAVKHRYVRHLPFANQGWSRKKCLWIQVKIQVWQCNEGFDLMFTPFVQTDSR